MATLKTCKTNLNPCHQALDLLKYYQMKLIIYVFVHFPCINSDLQSWDDSDWGWNDEEEEKAVENNKTNHNKSWLQECAFSISPTGDFLAIANEDRIVILQRKYYSLLKLICISFYHFFLY